MSSHVLLDNVTHRHLRILPGHGRGRGGEVNVARVFPVEFAALQREYPLFLMKNMESGHFDTVALLGFEEGENLFLTEQGWAAETLPLTIQRQPFLIGFREQSIDGYPQRSPVVHVDLGHPSVSFSEGESVFLPHGGEGPLLERVTSLLGTIHQGHGVAQSLSQLLVGLELTEPVTVEVEFGDGTRRSLTGLHGIHEARFQQLAPEALGALHASGHLQDVLLLRVSVQNVQRLVERKNQILSAGAKTGSI